MKDTTVLRLGGILVAGLLVVASGNAAVVGDPKAGQEKATACSTCHGLDGRGRVPLAGKSKDYLLTRMTAIKQGQDGDAAMRDILSQLSAQDLADLAAYYASREPR